MSHQWYGWEDETDLCNEDDREGVQYLTIADSDGAELAVIVHRLWGDERDAPVKARKEAVAQMIVDGLNLREKVVADDARITELFKDEGEGA